MAAKVSVIESEYDELISQVKNSHDDIFAEVKKLINNIEKLNCEDGGFFTDEISPKIDLVCTEFKSYNTKMKSVFAASEEIIESFKATIDNYDISL